MENQEKLIEQTEEMVKLINAENFTDEELDAMTETAIAEEDVNDTMSSTDADVSTTNTAKKLQKNGKKTIAQMADEVVNNFINDRSDKNWQAIQEFFWYGIKKWAYKYTNSFDDAEDMAIETFFNAHEKFDMFDPEKGRFSTWLFTLCRNNCIGFIKKKGRIQTINQDISDIYESTLASTVFAQDIDDADYELGTDGNMSLVDPWEIKQVLYNVAITEMQRFRGVSRTIMEMKELKNMKIREIAKELDMNESTVKNHLYRGRQDLANILKKKHKELYESYIGIRALEGQ